MKRIITLVLTLAALLVLTVTACADTIPGTAKLTTTPTKPGRRPSGTKTVQSGKTFDAGVGVYVGLSILSLTGSAVVIGKKRKTR